MTKRRKKYTAEFKREAVGLVTAHGYSYAEAGRSLDINSNLISRWHRELEANGGAAFSGNGKLSPDQQRIRELEHQVQCLEMEKAILKKATVFFARESR
jgi:transposase